jgi:hypothetical protein
LQAQTSMAVAQSTPPISFMKNATHMIAPEARTAAKELEHDRARSLKVQQCE